MLMLMLDITKHGELSGFVCNILELWDFFFGKNLLEPIEIMKYTFRSRIGLLLIEFPDVCLLYSFLNYSC